MTLTMYDSVESDQIPPGAQAAAGYVGGRFPDFFAIATRFPVLEKTGKLLSIAVNDQESARCLDVETGDASAAQAPAWVKRMLDKKVWRPCIYANASTMPAVEHDLQHAGLQRNDYRLWVADWTSNPHIPAGFDACQWTNKTPNLNDDRSLCLASFFPSFHTSPEPHGIVRATLMLDMESGHWHVHHDKGSGVHFTDKDEWASVQVQINEKTGKWRVHPMPFNAPPLGGR